MLQLGASAATFAQQVFIARVLGATEQTDGYQMALALALFVMPGLTTGPLVNGLVPRLARLTLDDADRARHYVFWAQLTLFVVTSALMIGLWIATPAIITVTAAGLSPATRFWAIDSSRIMVWATPIATLSGVYTASLYVSGDLRFVALAQAAQNVVAALFAILAYRSVGFAALPLSLVIGTLAGCALLFGRLHSRSLLPRQDRRYARVSFKSILTVTAGPLAVPILGSVPGFAERWFMSFFPVGQIAILGYVGRIVNVALAFGVSIGVVALARWSRGHAAGDGRGEVAATSRAAATALLFILLPGTVALVAMSDIVIHVLFGDSRMDPSQLATSTLALSIYALSLIPTALMGLLMRGFYAAENSGSAVGTTVVWVVLNVALDVALVPTFGLYGLATAYVLAVWTTLAIVLIGWRREPWISVWPAVLVSRETLAEGAISIVCVAGAGMVLRHVGLPWGLGVIPFAGATYLACSAAAGSSLAREVVRLVARRGGST